MEGPMQLQIYFFSIIFLRIINSLIPSLVTDILLLSACAVSLIIYQQKLLLNRHNLNNVEFFLYVKNYSIFSEDASIN